MNIRVIDPFTIKPLDAATIVSSARATGGRIITVEDHYKEGETSHKSQTCEQICLCSYRYIMEMYTLMIQKGFQTSCSLYNKTILV